MHRGFVVRPRSKEKIRDTAHRLLDVLRLDGRRVPVLQVIELGLGGMDDDFVFEVLDAQDMVDRFGMNAEGITVHRDKLIALRSDVYQKACAGEGRHRFTAAHELGHYFLHRDEGLALPRESDRTTKPFCDSEWQANQFAREFLVDLRSVREFGGPAEVAEHFQVSMQVAQIQWDEAKKMAP